MPRPDRVRLNVRSAFACTCAHELAKLTGMSAAQVVEEALRAYVPPAATVPTGRLVRRGPVQVRRASDERITFARGRRRRLRRFATVIMMRRAKE